MLLYYLSLSFTALLYTFTSIIFAKERHFHMTFWLGLSAVYKSSLIGGLTLCLGLILLILLDLFVLVSLMFILSVHL